MHLGKLARHLRMVGLDCVWFVEGPETEDSALLARAMGEGRVLLTRDRALSARGAKSAHLVQATDPAEQLLEIGWAFGLIPMMREGHGFLTRCLECNREILRAHPHQVHDRVPGHLLISQNEFFLCPRCERVYWRGSHYDRMRDWVRALTERQGDAPGSN